MKNVKEQRGIWKKSVEFRCLLNPWPIAITSMLFDVKSHCNFVVDLFVGNCENFALE